MISWKRTQALFARMHWGTLFAMFGLSTVGVLFIYSACYRGPQVPMALFYRKQLLWVALGFALFLVLTLTDYHWFHENAWLVYAGGLVLLVLVMVIGNKVNNAYRWLSIFGIRVQPSEFAKVGVIIMLAHYLARPSRDMASFATLGAVLFIAGVPFVLIMLEPDLGTAAIMLPVAVVMLFAAGLPFRRLAVLFVVGLLTLPLGWLILGTYQKERLLVFFDPGRDPLGAGWNKIQSAIAVGSGGLFGKGFLEGTQNVLGFLPRTVAPTDFIFSVIAEEAGFIGSIVVLLLFSVLLVGIVRAATRARDSFGCLLAVGMATMLFCHVFVNIAMTVGLMPITGLPLPLISYGGSFMISTMVALGLVQSVYVRRPKR